MATLIYSMLVSLDGYAADVEGDFGWAEPDAQVHRFINDEDRGIGTYLYGRRMYQIMAGWETDPSVAAVSPQSTDFAGLWQRAEKIVYSRTLSEVTTARTRIEREFSAESVRRIVAEASTDVTVGGPVLAAEAFRAGLVGECRLFLTPVVVGAGLRALPEDVRIRLNLIEHRRFDNGMVYLRYGVQH